MTDRLFCAGCPVPIDASPIPGLGSNCNGPVKIIGDVSGIEKELNWQYAKPDEKHQLGKVYCGRRYAPPVADAEKSEGSGRDKGGSGGAASTAAEQLWVDLEAAAGDTTIGNMLYHIGGLVLNAKVDTARILQGSGRPEKDKIAAHFTSGLENIRRAATQEAEFTTQLNNYLRQNLLTNPSGLQPARYEVFQDEITRIKGKHAVHGVSLAAVKNELQGQVDSLITATGGILEVKDLASKRAFWLRMVVGRPVTGTLEEAVKATSSCSGFADLAEVHVRTIYNTLEVMFW